MEGGYRWKSTVCQALLLEEATDALAHFFGSLVRESDSQYRAGTDTLMSDQIGGTGDNDPGLATARSCQQQERPFCVLYGLALLWVQRGKQRHAVLFILTSTSTPPILPS